MSSVTALVAVVTQRLSQWQSVINSTEGINQSGNKINTPSGTVQAGFAHVNDTVRDHCDKGLSNCHT